MIGGEFVESYRVANGVKMIAQTHTDFLKAHEEPLFKKANTFRKITFTLENATFGKEK